MPNILVLLSEAQSLQDANWSRLKEDQQRHRIGLEISSELVLSVFTICWLPRVCPYAQHHHIRTVAR